MFQAPRNKTLVKLNIESETIMIRDGIDGDTGTAYQTKQIGSIIVATNIRKENANAYDPIFGEVVTGEQKGLTAWFHKLNYREAQVYGNQNHILKAEDIGEEEGVFLLIEDSSIFFYTDSENNIHMKPEWTLCEPIEDVTWEYVDGVKIKCRSTTGGLIIPAMKEDYKTNKAVLRHIHPKVSQELGLSVGDVVFLDRACDLPVEDELNMKLGKMYFRVEVCNILGIDRDSYIDGMYKEWSKNI